MNKVISVKVKQDLGSFPGWTVMSSVHLGGMPKILCHFPHLQDKDTEGRPMGLSLGLSRKIYGKYVSRCLEFRNLLFIITGSVTMARGVV